MVRCASPSLLPTYINYLLSMLWAYVMTFSLIIGILWTVGLAPPKVLPGFQLIPEWWGLTLTITYLAQALVSHLLERRFEPHMLRSLFWIIWYPMAFWMINTATAVAALPIALLRPRKERTTWVSPDRGLR
jgi:biofilm PGA synthesis N-glycosyltransferase PgaC